MDKEKELELQNETDNDTVPSTRVDKHGHRRGKNPFAAFVGGLISLLSIVGVVSIVIGGIRWIRRATDTTALKEEFYYYLEPVLAYTPEPFDNIATAQQQDAFLDAAAYRVSIAEQVRMMQEQQKNSSAEVTCQYPVDDLGRIAVPVEEIEASYRALFGPDAPLTHRSVEANNLTYSAADKCYYVPFNDLLTNYRPVIESVKRKANSYTVRVGFVANNDIVIDNHGNEVPPTADMASYFQTYTFTRTDKEHYYISACKNE
jgi:hypothetical protein